MMDNIEYKRESLKDIVEKEAREDEEENTKDNINLTSTDNKRALKGAYWSFVIPCLTKADIDGYVDQIKRRLKALMEDQLNEMQSTKVIMMLWVRWKKPVISIITFYPEDVKGSTIQVITASKKRSYWNLMREFFEGSNI